MANETNKGDPTFDKQIEGYSKEEQNENDPVFSHAYHKFMVNLLKTRDKSVKNELISQVNKINKDFSEKLIGDVNEVIEKQWIRVLKDELEVHGKKLNNTMLRIADDVEEIHIKLKSVEDKIVEHDGNLLTIQDDINILKSRNTFASYTIRGIIYITIAVILFMLLFPWAHKHLAWFNNNQGRLMTTEEVIKTQNAPTRAIHIMQFANGVSKEKQDSIKDAGIKQDQSEILAGIKARDDAYNKKWGKK